VPRDHGVNDGLSAVARLVLCECKSGDVPAIGRNLTYMTLTVELESRNAQSVLLE
jgi:hypothetical protein